MVARKTQISGTYLAAFSFSNLSLFNKIRTSESNNKRSYCWNSCELEDHLQQIIHTVEHFVEFPWWGVFDEVRCYPHLGREKHNLVSAFLLLITATYFALRRSLGNTIPFLRLKWGRRNQTFLWQIFYFQDMCFKMAAVAIIAWRLLGKYLYIHIWSKVTSLSNRASSVNWQRLQKTVSTVRWRHHIGTKES